MYRSDFDENIEMVGIASAQDSVETIRYFVEKF